MSDTEMKAKLKKALSDGILASSTQKTLKQMGFTIAMGKKHCKIYYKDDKRRCVTIAKSLSDTSHGIMNITHDLIRMMKFVESNQ